MNPKALGFSPLCSLIKEITKPKDKGIDSIAKTMLIILYRIVPSPAKPSINPITKEIKV